MCDDFELEQNFESPEIQELTSCDVPSSMADCLSPAMDENSTPSSGNDLFDSPLKMSMGESLDAPNLNDIRFNGSTETSFDDLEKIKQELDDELSISSHEIDYLKEKAEGIERLDNRDEISFKGIKICATRHGCTGATNCDYESGGPVGR